MRLFTAIDLPPEVRASVDDFIGQLRPLARLGWTLSANLHITTRFIGDWPEERLPELQRALAALSSRAPIPIRVHGLGLVPNGKSPRILLAHADAPPELSELARDLGYAERRAYSPHVTLARIKSPKGLGPLVTKLAELGDPDFGAFLADRFFLYQSKPSAAGSVYTKLSEFPFSL